MNKPTNERTTTWFIKFETRAGAYWGGRAGQFSTPYSVVRGVRRQGPELIKDGLDVDASGVTT